MLTRSMTGILAAREAALTHQRATAGTNTSAGIRAEEFEQIVRDHQQRIYRTVMALTRDADAAETLTQECFLRAYRKRASFRGEARISTWLVRIAINLVKDHARNRRRAFWSRLIALRQPPHLAPAQSALEVPDPGAGPERAATARQQLAAVWTAADQLAPQQRTVFLLRFAQEMSLEEIAEAMELEVGTVKAHLFRAVGAVRRRLAAPGSSPSKLVRQERRAR